MMTFWKKLKLIFTQYFFILKSRARSFLNIAFWITQKPDQQNRKRILTIYDVTNQPFSIGDFILIQETSLILCEKNKIKITDVVIVFDINSRHSEKEFSSITGENLYYNIASILPIVQINQNLGSVFIFNSNNQFENFLSLNHQNYITWPSITFYAQKKYIYYEALNNIINDYYQKNNYIPLLKCREFLISWADSFYQENLNSQIPVTINLRKNKLFGAERNSDMDIWFEFLKSCDKTYNVKFIIIGSKQEVDDRMRNLKNVLIAKDFNTGIEQDLALISSSEFHMGASSGPISMAWFSGKPYLQFSWDADISHYKGLVKLDENFFRFGFANENQKITKKRETSEFIKNEFDKIINQIKTNRELKAKKKNNNQNLMWLR